MAGRKKTVDTAAAKGADTKTEELMAAQAESAAEAKEEGANKTTRKTTTKRASARKTTTKTTTKKAAAKKIESSVVLQFDGKEYTDEDLVKIAKDVWKYDLKQKVGDFKSVKLYVKPEENTVYYVINDDVTGEFAI